MNVPKVSLYVCIDNLPYARHYNLRFVYFFTSLLYSSAVYITDNLWTKNGNSSFFKPKIRGLYSRAVSDRERAIMARVRYVHNFCKSYNDMI